MVFPQRLRKLMRGCKSYAPVQSIVFDNGCVYLLYEGSAIKLAVIQDLFSSLELERKHHFEGSGVKTIMDLITNGADFLFANTGLTVIHKNMKSVFKPTFSPEYRIPTHFQIDPPDFEWKVKIDEVKKLTEGLKFAFKASKLANKTSLYSNRMFFSLTPRHLFIFGTNNAVFNVFFSGYTNSHSRNGAIILPGKLVNNSSRLLLEYNSIELTSYNDYAILESQDSELQIYLPSIMGDTPDIDNLLKKVRKSENQVSVNKELLEPPKEMLSVGDVVELRFTPNKNITETILSVGANSLYDTGLVCPSDIDTSVIKLKKNEFFECLSSLSESILIRWTSASPVFVSVNDENKMTVQAIVLEET